jgi:hypothetical protein
VNTFKLARAVLLLPILASLYSVGHLPSKPASAAAAASIRHAAANAQIRDGAARLARTPATPRGVHDQHIATRGRITNASAALDATPTGETTALSSTALSTGHAIKTVFVIVMENNNWSTIKGSASAPYINGTLLPMASHAERYYNPSGIHPSLPNYLWLEAGTNFGILDDSSPWSHRLGTTSHLSTLLNNAGISWKAFEENITGTSCPLSDSYPYAARHNPFIYFTDVTANLSTTSAYCIAHERPYAHFAYDLQSNSVARYNFITPNLCDDMHDSCAPLYNAVKQGDTWLAGAVPQILNSQAYKNGGALFITWDEGAGSNGPIGLIALSPDAKGHGFSDTLYYTHSSLLRTLEEIFGVGPLLGGAATATDLRDLFVTFP